MNEADVIVVDDTDGELEDKAQIVNETVHVPSPSVTKLQPTGHGHGATPSSLAPRDDPPKRLKGATVPVSASPQLHHALNRPLTPTTRPPPTTEASRTQLRAFERVEWPHRIVNLRKNFNPDGIAFPCAHHFGSSGCLSPCRHHTCRNANLGIFCASNCCPFAGNCGNGVMESRDVAIMRKANSRSLTVVATREIPMGVVIGQYLGRLTLEGPCRDRIRNSGYRLIMKDAPKQCGKWRVCIDAELFGGKMRFVNHTCRSSAIFKEVSNGLNHTVVVVSTETIKKGVEVTVDYGNDLWFICRCGYTFCRHRDIQDLSDP